MGDPEVLVYEEVQKPAPKVGEVLIKIETIGVNYADKMRRRGDDYPDPSPVPFILGVEIAGTIESLGENVQIYEVYPPTVNTEFSAEIGGANGIPPSEVADELFLALSKNQLDVPVGDSKNFFEKS